MSNGVNFRKLSLDLRDQLNQVTAELNTLKHPMNSAAIARKERDALQQRLTKAEEELDLLQAQAVNDTEANTAIRAERDALQLMLNNRDDLDDQLTSLKQRRYAEQQAREAAERRVEELEGLLLKLKDPTDEMVEAGNEAAVIEMEHDDDLRSYGWINNSDEVLSAMIDAALNPTAEAVSHE